MNTIRLVVMLVIMAALSQPCNSYCLRQIAYEDRKEQSGSFKDSLNGSWYVKDTKDRTIKAHITPLTLHEIGVLGWDWKEISQETCRSRLESGFNISKLTIEGSDQMEGMIIWLRDRHSHFGSRDGLNGRANIPLEVFDDSQALYIHMLYVLEGNRHNSKNRKIKNIGTSLLAFMVAESIRQGRGGKVYIYSNLCDTATFYTELGMTKVPDKLEGWWFYFTEEKGREFLANYRNKGASHINYYDGRQAEKQNPSLYSL